MANISRYCCCDDPCSECSNDGATCGSCDDSNELTYTAVVSGLTFCGCLTSIGGNIYSWVHATALNGSHTITQTASACIWEVTYTNAVREDQYFNTDCTGGIATTNYYDATFRMSINSSAATFEIEISSVGRNSMFIDEPAMSGECCELPTFTNDNTVSDCGTNGPPLGAARIAYGGTVTVSC